MVKRVRAVLIGIALVLLGLAVGAMPASATPRQSGPGPATGPSGSSPRQYLVIVVVVVIGSATAGAVAAVRRRRRSRLASVPGIPAASGPGTHAPPESSIRAVPHSGPPRSVSINTTGTASQPRPDTALTLLFGPDEQVLDALAHAIVSAGADGNLDRAAGKLPQAVRDAAAREVTAVTACLLDISLIDLLVAGWCEYPDLTSAARRTLDAPGSAELVQPVTHRVSVSQRPYVSVLVDGHQVATVQLSLSVVFDVSAMLARVRAGRLAGVHAGSCDITATLAIDDMDVASKQTHLDLPGEIALRGELRLLPARDYPVAEYKATAVDNVRA